MPREGDIKRQANPRLEFLRKRLDMRPRLVVDIGDRQFCPERAKGLGAAPGDRLLVGDADDEALFAFEQLCFHCRNHCRILGLRTGEQSLGVPGDYQFLVRWNDQCRDTARRVGDGDLAVIIGCGIESHP